MRKLTCLVALVLLAVFGQICNAQSATGQVTGLVKDSTGAVIAGVTVTLSSQLTGITRTTTTTDAGVYTFTLLPVGVYSVSVDQKGFRGYRQSDISLNVDQVQRVDVELTVGEVSSTVEVRAAAVAIDAESATVGQTVVQKQVTDLPLNGRNFTQLLFMGNGTVSVNAEQGTMRQGQGGGISINGARPESNNFVLDGSSITDTSLVTPAVVLSVDAIQEFKVQSSMYSAEYGFSANQINVISKSGSNDLHGALFGFDRNDAFDARSFFNVSGIPSFRQNQFGFVAGGPVWIPKVYKGRNRTFWLANYEGERIRQGSVQSGVVPDPTLLTGQFSSAIIDPTTGNPFAGNFIPADRFARLAKVAISNHYFPGPNANVGGNNFYSTLPTPTDVDQQTYRIDQYMGKWGTLFGRYTHHNFTNTSANTITPLGNYYLNEKSTNWQVNHTANIGTHMANQFRISYLDAIANNYGVAMPQDQVSALGLKSIYQNLPDIERTWPDIGLQGYAGVGGAVNAFTASEVPIWDISDTFTIVRGSHTISLGAEYRRWESDRELANEFLGGYGFSGYFTGNAVADLELGYSSGAQNFEPGPYSNPNVPGAPHSYQFRYFAPFVQDDWKVSRNLTVNLGLRWDYRNVPYAADNRMFWLDVTNPNGGLCVADQQLVKDGIAGGSSYYRYCGSNTPAKGSKKPFAPRVGFAYRPFAGDKTVIRGGYGIFFDSSETREIDNSGDLYPYISRSSVSQSVGTTPLLTTNDLFPPTSVSGPPNPQGGDNTFIAVIISERPVNPYVQQWNLSVQRQLSNNTKLEVYYLGTKGTHLLQRRNIAQAYAPTAAEVASGNIPSVPSRKPYANFPGFYIDSDWSGYSSYQSLNTKLEHRTGPLVLNVVYTWAKSLDDKSSAAASGNTTAGWQGFMDNHNTRLDYGPSDFSVAHRAVTSFVYEVPIGRGKTIGSSWSKAADAVIGGWQLNGIVTFQKGFPYSIETNDTGGLLDRPFGAAIRANVIRNPMPSGFQQSINGWFNTAAFQQPGAGLYGTLGRNTYVGPGLNNWDMSMFKNFRFGELRKLELRMETFNTWNHAQWGAPGFNLTSASTFGKISTTQVPGRIVQLGGKFLF
jgi:hypothetical protein